MLFTNSKLEMQPQKKNQMKPNHFTIEWIFPS